MTKTCLELTLPELQTLAAENATVLIPVGWAEARPDIPFGRGGNLANQMCIRLAETLEKTDEARRTVILPVLPFALDAFQPSTAIRLRAHVLRDWILDITQSMARIGFKNFICVSSIDGPKTLTAIEEASYFLARRGRFWG